MLRRTSSSTLRRERSDSIERNALRPLLTELGDGIRLIRRILSRSAFAFVAGAVGLVVLGTAAGAVRAVPILSGSMAPAFGAGDVVLVSPAPLESVRIGDVITYHPPVGDRALLTHRVVEVVERGSQPVVRTRGDANAAADPWKAQLRGETLWRVTGAVPAVGHAMLLFRRPWLRTFGVWVVLAIALAAALSAVWRRPSTPAPAR